MNRLAALAGAAAIALGLLGAATAGAVGGGEIAVVSSGGVTVTDHSAIDLIPSDRLATSSNSKLLAAVKGGFYDLQWTPDGKTLLYVQETGKPTRENLYAVDVASLRRRLLAANVGGAHPKDLSPDGKTVAYTPDRTPGVYLVGIDGRSRRHLIDAGERSPTWSPDSKRLAIVNGLNSIEIIGADGKGARRVTLGGSRFDTVLSIAWGPAGKSLLVDIVGLNTFGESIIELVGLDGHVLRRLTTTGFPSSGAWSPEGTQVAFVERRGAKQYAVVVGADGSGRHTVDSIGRSTNVSLGWSPDGRSVVTANGSQVRVVNADGTGARIVANAAGSGSLADPAWRPGS